MIKLLSLLLLFFCAITCPRFARAGKYQSMLADSGKRSVSGKALSPDSIAIKAPAKHATQMLKSGVAAPVSDLKRKLDVFKKGGIDYNLVLGEGVRYNPVPVFPAISNAAKFQNIFSVRGAINLYGVPVNLDYTTDRASGYGRYNPYNDLFKFDFQAGNYTGLWKSDLQQYSDMRKQVFGGLNVTGYATRVLTDKLEKYRHSSIGGPQFGIMTAYLNSPGKVNELLVLDKAGIRTRLQKELPQKLTQTPANSEIPTSLPNLSETLAGNGAPIGLTSLQSHQYVLSGISRSTSLSQYFKDGTNMQELRLMNRDQIASKIYTLTKNDAAQNLTTGKPDSTGIPISGTARDSALRAASYALAGRMMVSARQGDSNSWQLALNAEQASIISKADSVSPAVVPFKTAGRKKKWSLSKKEKAEMDREIEDVAEAVDEMKRSLAASGTDINKLLLMQKYQESGGIGFPDEVTTGLLTKKPNDFQRLFSHLNELKIGAFGNRLSSGPENQDLFMKGGHITIKSGGIPLSFGYGTVNDVTSPKDQQFRNSVFNQPRDITYIGAELKKAGAGNLKLSVISALSRGGNYNNYSNPSISSNNVALTLSKNLDLGNWGDFGFNVSKSNTLYSNKYQVGAEAVLDQKGGLNHDVASDLFQSLSFGFDHHLDIQGLGASDDVYFNYAGMGYRNPAASGFGGGKTKFGGSLRKFFYGNKLSVNLRTDITNTPISYTSSDRWKNYQIQVDGRYQLSKKINADLKYIASGTGKEVDGLSSRVYSFRKIQFDGNASYKIGKYRSVSHLTVGEQLISNSFAPATAGSVPASGGTSGLAAMSGANLLLVNYTQNLLIHKNVLTANVFFNRELGGYKLIGNMLNADMAWQFTVLGNVSMSSGLTYLDNSGIARQAGLRETISLMAGSRFNVETYVDIRKNMIRPLYPDLYANYRAQLSVFYKLRR